MRRSVRHLVIVVAPIAAAVATTGACASPYASTDSAVVPVEAGSDSRSSIASEAGLVPTPGAVECFVDTCKVNDKPVCCLARDGGTTSCMTSCKAGDYPFTCDDRTDCGPGQVCCVGLLGDTACTPSCNNERLCRSDSECDTGSTCLAVPCRGKVIGACGPLGTYVKSVCSQ